MDTAHDSIETMFREKLMLYQQLAALLEQEKKEIAKAEIAELWKMSVRKQRLVEEIQKIRENILEAASKMSIDHNMTPGNFETFRLISLLPVEHRRRLGGIEASLLSLKKEVRNISMESRQSVELRLGMINELISIMTGCEQNHQVYGAVPNSAGSDTPKLFRGEA